ncbi:MAG: Lrp/AsnC family transcriptional regulator [Lentisphaeria bacterium]|nr:Lrp/AsnC family transcriptional regulator [Lentisphaeria bacterium]
MKAAIIKLLTENARFSLQDIAARLGITAAEADKIIKELEADKVICGYTAILNENELAENYVRALIEVKVTPQRDGGFDKIAKRLAKFAEVTDLYLVSGNYDLRVEVKGKTLQEVANFVAAKLSTIDGVLSTSTLFLLKKYKESGRIIDNDEEYNRLKICP